MRSLHARSLRALGREVLLDRPVVDMDAVKTRIALFGPPGSGKGTQAKILAERWGLRHISTGKILRKDIAAGTRVGKVAMKYMNAGRLVPDDIVRTLANTSLEGLGYDGFILDGYPRTLPQAQWLTDRLRERRRPLDTVLLIKLSDEMLVHRLTRRRVNILTGENFHLDHKPPTGVDPELVVQRPDDRPDAVRERLRVYRAQTLPVEMWYRREGVLSEVDGDGPIDEIHERVVRVLRGGSP